MNAWSLAPELTLPSIIAHGWWLERWRWMNRQNPERLLGRVDGIHLGGKHMRGRSMKEKEHVYRKEGELWSIRDMLRLVCLDWSCGSCSHHQKKWVTRTVPRTPTRLYTLAASIKHLWTTQDPKENESKSRSRRRRHHPLFRWDFSLLHAFLSPFWGTEEKR